jgi:hypothetical protein
MSGALSPLVTVLSLFCTNLGDTFETIDQIDCRTCTGKEVTLQRHLHDNPPLRTS